MLDKKRLAIWIGLVFAFVCLLCVSYYLVNDRFTVSTGDKTDIQTDLKRAKEIAAKMEEAEYTETREEVDKSFAKILNGPPERLVVEAILKGDSDSAAKTAKIWQISEPENEIAQRLVSSFRRTRACGNEVCAIPDYNEGFNNWLKNLSAQHPDNLNISLMTTDGMEDSKSFTRAIKTKDSNLDFNFGVNLCSFWIGAEVTDRLRKDWNDKKSVPTALRLAQRLTCCNDDFCATAKDGQEAQKVLEKALTIASVNDLESIKDAYLWAKARQAKETK